MNCSDAIYASVIGASQERTGRAGRIPANVATPRALEDVMGSKKDSSVTRGPAPLGGQRIEFARLISIGVSNTEPCRRIGVNRRTGTRWRLGRRAVLASGVVLEYAPVTTSRSSKNSRASYSCDDERVLMGDGLRVGATMTRTAADQGRATSTISRKVHRNSDESGRPGSSRRTPDPWHGCPGPGSGDGPRTRPCGTWCTDGLHAVEPGADLPLAEDPVSGGTGMAP